VIGALALNVIGTGFVAVLVFRYQNDVVPQAMKQLAGVLYVGLLLSFLVLLRNHPQGIHWIFLSPFSSAPRESRIPEGFCRATAGFWTGSMRCFSPLPRPICFNSMQDDKPAADENTSDHTGLHRNDRLQDAENR
jgi:hypothetical protein